jgi:hypothetical protein
MKYIDICVLAGAMTGESALTPDGRTRNYHSHTVFVCQENQGPWLMSYDYVAHILHTAGDEYGVFIPSEDLG